MPTGTLSIHLRVLLTLLIVLAVLFVPTGGWSLTPSRTAAAETSNQWLTGAGTPGGLSALKAVVAGNEEAYRKTLSVKGIYVPGNLVPTQAYARLISLVERTELNAVVIDVKSDEGYIYFDSQLPIVNEIGAERIRLRDASTLLRELSDKGIYTIARVVTFKDSQLGRGRPEWAIQTASGQPWRDRTGQIWMDPYNKDVWQYNIDVACEAAALGFKEIQFDYVRFPSDGRVGSTVYPKRDNRDKTVVIAEFVAEARRQLQLCGAYTSADIFGQIPSAVDDMGIGQQWDLMAGVADYLSPMAYPSHYGPGVYGLPDPDVNPGRTVFHSVSDAYSRFDKVLKNGLPERLTNRVGEVPDDLLVSPGDQVADVRPWLQDFSLRHHYGAAEVRAQIDAAYEAGATQWLLWNPAGRYTEAALQKAQ